MRNAFHVIISLLMWCLFGYYWVVVSRGQISHSAIEALGVLGVVFTVGVLVTVWWIAHNKKLARRNRRNTAGRAVPEDFRNDWLGRPLDRPETPLLHAAQIIGVDLQQGEDGEVRKRYLILNRDGL